MSKSKRLRFIPVLLLVGVLMSFGAPCAYALDVPSVEAEAIVVADITSDTVLYQKNWDAQRSPASLTKIMTGLIAVEAIESGRAKLTDMVTAQEDCRQGLDTDSSTVNIKPTEVMSFEDLLYCALVHSANEACNVIGTYLAGSIQGFVNEMNKRAREIGCTGTQFADTNGLSNDNHFTTAHDLYLITKEAMSHPLFVTVVNTKYYVVGPTNLMSEPRELATSNALMVTDGFYGPGYIYEGAAGVKTGFTKKAGYCLISTCKKNDKNILCVVMGCRGPYATYPQDDYGNFTATIKLYNWVFNNFSYKTIYKAGDPIQREPVDKAGEDAAVILRPKQEITCLLPNDIQDSEIVTNIVLDQTPLVAPIPEDAELGTANIYYNGELLKSVRLVTFDEVKLEKGVYFREKMAEFFSAAWIRVLVVIAVLAIVVYLTLLIRYRIMRKHHLKRRKAADKYRQAHRSYEEHEQMRIQNEMRSERRFTPPAEEDPTQRFSDREDVTMRYYPQQRQQNHRFTSPDDDPYERYYGSGSSSSTGLDSFPDSARNRPSRFSDPDALQGRGPSPNPRYTDEPKPEAASRFTDSSRSAPSQKKAGDYSPKFADPDSFQPLFMPDDLQSFSSVDPSVRDNADTDIDELLRSLGLDN